MPHVLHMFAYGVVAALNATQEAVTEMTIEDKVGNITC